MMAGTEFTGRKRTANTKEDIISNLPKHLTDLILERMPVRDAAKTSILSRKWRYVWATLPVLLVDGFFAQETFKNKPFHDLEYVALITKILLLHRGPIHKFKLNLPKFNSDCSSDIDQWIQFLSRNGIMNLFISNCYNSPYVLSSYIFSCPELTDLMLSNFVIKPPESYSFHKVVKLVFIRIAFQVNLLQTLFSNAPLLQWLYIANCTGIDHFYIDAPHLQCLLVHCCYQFKSLEFKKMPNLTTVIFTPGNIVSLPYQWKASGFIELVRSLPRIVNLMFDGSLLKMLGAGTLPRRLPTTMKYLKLLILYRIDLTDLNQISCALSLLRSSTNLMELELVVSETKKTVNDHVLNLMEERECADLNLERLETVKFILCKGSRAELLFVKLLLAQSKSLKRMFVKYNGVVVADEQLEDLKKIDEIS